MKVNAKKTDRSPITLSREFLECGLIKMSAPVYDNDSVEHGTINSPRQVDTRKTK